MTTGWRLPRQTSNLPGDFGALIVASMTATTDDQRAACVLRERQLVQRRTALIEQTYGAFVKAMRPAVEQAMEAISSCWSALRAAGSDEAQEQRHDPDDSRWAAALRAKRMRNVGPRTHGPGHRRRS